MPPGNRKSKWASGRYKAKNVVTDHSAQSESILLMFIHLELLLHNDHDIYYLAHLYSWD